MSNIATHQPLIESHTRLPTIQFSFMFPEPSSGSKNHLHPGRRFPRMLKRIPSCIPSTTWTVSSPGTACSPSFTSSLSWSPLHRHPLLFIKAFGCHFVTYPPGKYIPAALNTKILHFKWPEGTQLHHQKAVQRKSPFVVSSLVGEMAHFPGLAQLPSDSVTASLWPSRNERPSNHTYCRCPYQLYHYRFPHSFAHDSATGIGKLAKSEESWTALGELFGELILVIGWFLAVINSHHPGSSGRKLANSDNELNVEEELIDPGSAWDYCADRRD